MRAARLYLGVQQLFSIAHFEDGQITLRHGNQDEMYTPVLADERGSGDDKILRRRYRGTGFLCSTSDTHKREFVLHPVCHLGRDEAREIGLETFFRQMAIDQAPQTRNRFFNNRQKLCKLVD